MEDVSYKHEQYVKWKQWIWYVKKTNAKNWPHPPALGSHNHTRHHLVASHTKPSSVRLGRLSVPTWRSVGIYRQCGRSSLSIASTRYTKSSIAEKVKQNDRREMSKCILNRSSEDAETIDRNALMTGSTEWLANRIRLLDWFAQSCCKNYNERTDICFEYSMRWMQIWQDVIGDDMIDFDRQSMHDWIKRKQIVKTIEQSNNRTIE